MVNLTHTDRMLFAAFMHLSENIHMFGGKKIFRVFDYRGIPRPAVGNKQFMENASYYDSEIRKILNSKNIWPQGF